ncbi:MAG: VWA domain-containing protein [Dehalococcoidia bacterium]
MARSNEQEASHEEGQVLILFALGLVAFIGFVAMSVDVGRLVWARTQIQAAVDASALAAAQSMSEGTSPARSKAEEYWDLNAGFIVAQGDNVALNISFPTGNRAVKVSATADIPTWFARIFGVDHWTVGAEGTAASQVLDISVVLDISGSMCWASYGPIDRTLAGQTGPYVGPGRTADQVRLTTAIPPSGGDTITINVNRTDILTNTNSATNNSRFGYSFTGAYKDWTPSNGRRGMIRIENEVFQIVTVPSATTIQVTRARANTFTGQTATVKAAHPAGAELELYRRNCEYAAPDPVAGPFAPYQGMIVDAKHFTTLFNTSYDRIGLVSFSSQATHRSDLTSNFSSVRSAMDAIIRPDGGTNSAHGIAGGRIVLDGPGARLNSKKVLVFLTDGRANSYCGSGYSAANYNSISSCPGAGGGTDGNSSAVNAAIAEATRAAAQGATIYTIGFGPFVDDAFLTNIAAIGNGIYYKAPTPAQLDDAFAAIAAQTHISLTQ